MIGTKKQKKYMVRPLGREPFEIKADDDQRALEKALKRVKLSGASIGFCIFISDGTCIFAGHKWSKKASPKHQVTGYLNMKEFKMEW